MTGVLMKRENRERGGAFQAKRYTDTQRGQPREDVGKGWNNAAVRQITSRARSLRRQERALAQSLERGGLYRHHGFEFVTPGATRE